MNSNLSACKAALSQWPVLANQRQSAIIKGLLEAIAQKLMAQPVKQEDISLAGGATGYTLFLQNYQQSLDGNAEYSDFNQQLWQNIYQQLAQQDAMPSLYCGYAGVAWAMDYLQRNSQSNDVVEDYNQDIDEVLVRGLSCQQWDGEYETVLGLNGLALYGLSRLSLGRGRQIAELAIGHLLQMARRDENGVHWADSPNGRYRDKSLDGEQVNLGLAHGMSGVIAVLTRAVKSRVLPEYTQPLLRDACNWLLAQKNGPSCQSYFSTNNRVKRTSRLAWCYGDLSNGYVLYKAGLVLDDETIISAAMEILLATCERDRQSTAVVDAGFCHGTCSLLLMYQRLYFYSGEAAFKRAAEYWLAETLVLAQSKPELQGLHYFYGPDKAYREFLGLLEGVSGIGLVLLAVISPVEPDWDDIFLLG